ncbi:IS30 family transposase [Paenibacillus sp. Leaf72]|uniref:IS30 family transposase n=1 Tax=Paenibacillus sp. Leaf72 TaxID=1736234 RepID=UPI0006F6C0B6|nr:IS30 family transposase [Paenibacillus sp. Leaf72]KQN98938.1 integrase [Paenibacillus sp. Leaf72]
MSYQHLTTRERSQLELLHQLGWSARAIARKLGRHHSSLSRELKRQGTEESYCADRAQTSYITKRARCKPSGKWNAERQRYITMKLAETWSPEQIEGRMKRDEPHLRVCHKTIYRWLYQGRLVKGNTAFLRHKGKRRQPLEKRGRFTIGLSIHQRAKEIRKRETFGHWELDTVVSSRGKSKACVATFAERKTRFYHAIKMQDRTASSMEMAYKQAVLSIPATAFVTATVDRGKEFACHERLTALHGMKVYFANPYSSWQRGTNENANGLLREFFPKGYDFADVTEEELACALFFINNRPRKCLGWKTAHEAFQVEVSHLA